MDDAQPQARTVNANDFIELTIMSAWGEIASSLSVLASGEARDSLTMSQDIAATYIAARVALNKLSTELERAPAELLDPESPSLDAARYSNLLAINKLYEASITPDDLRLNPVDELDDPRAICFVQKTMAYVDAIEKAGKATIIKMKQTVSDFSDRLERLDAEYPVQVN